MRTYEQTHPWIKFKIDYSKAPHKFWMLLGEAQSKCSHIAGVPLLPSVTQYLHQVYLAKGALATTAIEGNTLTEEEVMARLEGKLKLPPSKEYLGQEIDNIIEACNIIRDRVFEKGSTQLSVEDIKEYNKLVLKDLRLNDQVVPGKIRKHEVGVARYRAAPSDDCEYLLNKLCNWINDSFNSPNKEDKIAYGIIKAIITHVYLAWIHPFGDGNGRTARLLEFQFLLCAGVPTASAHLLSNHYNETRQEYYRQLDQTSKSGGDLIPFSIYALQGYVDALKSQIDVIQAQQLEVHWENFVYDQFRNKDKSADIRRRHLVFDLSREKEPVPFSKLRHVSPRIAEAYANKTSKTIVRDVNILVEMKLIKRTEKGYEARKEIILAFLLH